VGLPSPPAPLPNWEREARSPVPLLPAWEKGLGEGFAPLREEGEDLDVNKSAFLSWFTVKSLRHVPMFLRLIRDKCIPSQVVEYHEIAILSIFG